jgi:two-component system, chemotaxis family, chemotaxis protein CheY
MFGSEVLFSGITLVVGAADPKESSILKGVLASLGSERILSASAPDILLGAIMREQVDIVVLDWQLRGGSAASAIGALRRQPDSIRSVPVVMTGSGADPENIVAARDAGVDEYVTKPFTTASLLEAIQSVIQAPRAFVISRSYCGPDRRGSRSFTRLLPTVPHEEERRGYVASPVYREALFSSDPVMPVLVPPSYALKAKLGLDIPASPSDPGLSGVPDLEFDDVAEDIRCLRSGDS